MSIESVEKINFVSVGIRIIEDKIKSMQSNELISPTFVIS